MSNNYYEYPPSTGGGDGVGEAYPSWTADRSEDAAARSGDYADDGAMHVYSRPLDQTNGGGGFSRRSSEASRASFVSSQRYPPGERSVAASFAAGRAGRDDDDDDDGLSERPRRRSVYEEAQSQSSRRFGGILYQESATSRSGRLSSSWTSGSGGVHSSLRSGASPAGPTYFNPRHRDVGVSLSGNLLLRVEIEEELELDKDEMRALADNVKSNEDAAAAASTQFQLLNDASTIGTTRSTRSHMSKASKSVEVDGNPDGSMNIVGGPQTELDKRRMRMKEIIFSPPFRRTLFLGICFVLLGVGVLLTLENFMSVKSARDWVEPHRDRYWMEHGGGLDWAFGSDAPRPIAGAHLDHSIESCLADWHVDTSRVPAVAGMDGFGSVAVTEAAMFDDVPVFWGLPFAGGDIVESVLGQCLHLVQASDKGVQDGDAGDDLRLRTVPVDGKTYLNVDLSTLEGIERARALALGTSGMADVAHSPLLHEASELFSPMNRGRLFVLVRHPAEREFARFRHMRRWRDGELLGEDNRKMTYAEYARSDLVADNWMTRTLVQKGQDEDLTAKDMQTAKEMLRRKAVVGLYRDIIGALRHYARHFGWDHARNGGKLNKGTLSCFERAILDGMMKDMEHAGDLVEKDSRDGSVAWGKVMNKNKFDFELYIYSQQLYKFQIALS